MNKKNELTGRDVTVKWKGAAHHNCPINMYTLYYRVVGPVNQEDNWTVVNITNTSVTSYELQLQYSREYEIMASAWNKLGESKRKGWYLKTALGT